MKTLFAALFVLAVIFLLVRCSSPPAPPIDPNALKVQARWLKTADSGDFLDPQPSALKAWRSRLLSISDRSALPVQQKHIHIINPASATVEKSLPIVLSDAVKNSCFGAYLAGEPDYEALAVDSRDDSVFYLATEDARQSGGLNHDCQKQYGNSGSTDYPALLVRIKLQGDRFVANGVRALAYANEDDVGDYPNDGLEGLTMVGTTLYLGKEKDAKSKARVFKLNMDDAFWRQSDFAYLQDAKLLMPVTGRGNHPINAMDYLPASKPHHPGYLLAAARNDNQLWLLDLAQQQPAKVIPLAFYAPAQGDDCAETELMHNYSIEGLAIVDDQIWLVNDPWKPQYPKNIQCKNNTSRYQQYVPLLVNLPTSALHQ